MIIAIEGIDGAGKNTQAQLLHDRLAAAGISVGMLSFPRYGETLMALSIADYLNGKFGELSAIPPQFPALLYAGDRFESKALLHELEQANDVLLIDRYVASNFAHQAAKVKPEERPAFIDWIARIEYEVYGLPRPAITIYLDIPTDASAELVSRKKPRSYTTEAADLHEKDMSYLAACRDVYLSLDGTDHAGRWIPIQVLDASGTIRPPQEIGDEIWEKIRGAWGEGRREKGEGERREA
jgi:dTMP kinase